MSHRGRKSTAPANLMFHEISTDDLHSPWYYFLRSDSKPRYGKCKHCSATIKSEGGSTSGLWNHLKAIHPSIVPNKVTESPNDVSKPTSRIGPICQYIEKTSLEKESAIFVAVDGISFHTLANSQGIKKGLISQKFENIPKDHKTIKAMVMKYAEQIKSQNIISIKSLLKQNVRFTLTFDEWTSNRNRRFLSLVLHHSNSKIISLGLFRVTGQATATNLLSLVECSLEQFNSSFKNHIVCIMTDGCRTMESLGTLAKPVIQQLCFAHALQLVVLDVLYKKTDFSYMNNQDDIAALVFDEMFSRRLEHEEEDLESDLTFENLDAFKHELQAELNDLVSNVFSDKSPTTDFMALNKYVIVITVMSFMSYWLVLCVASDSKTPGGEVIAFFNSALCFSFMIASAKSFCFSSEKRSFTFPTGL